MNANAARTLTTRLAKPLTFILLVPILLTVASSTAFAQSQSFISIPASGFTSFTSGGGNIGYIGNLSGTSRSFTQVMFAPVNLPHEATVTSLRCGGRAFFRHSIEFTLRRNDPQQANVDMATVMTSLEGTGFEFVNTNSVESGRVDNSRFNYYIVAAIQEEVDPPTRPFCPTDECRLTFCSIGFTEATVQGVVRP